MLIFIADDELKVRSALRLLIEQEEEWRVTGEAADADALLAQVPALYPDLVMLDWELPGLQPYEHLAALKSAVPGLKIIALSGRIRSAQAAISSGVDAFVSKGDPPEVVLSALQAYFPGRNRKINQDHNHKQP